MPPSAQAVELLAQRSSATASLINSRRAASKDRPSLTSVGRALADGVLSRVCRQTGRIVAFAQ
jgi:hypothetical protein